MFLFRSVGGSVFSFCERRVSFLLYKRAVLLCTPQYVETTSYLFHRFFYGEHRMCFGGTRSINEDNNAGRFSIFYFRCFPRVFKDRFSNTYVDRHTYSVSCRVMGRSFSNGRGVGRRVLFSSPCIVSDASQTNKGKVVSTR